MKSFCKIFTSAALAAVLSLNTAVSVSGYSLNNELAASEYESLEDYLENSPEVREIVKDDAGGGRYETVCNYICLPVSLADKIDSISNILITPTYCETTFELESGKVRFSHYFDCDNKDSCYYFEIYADKTTEEAVGDALVYAPKGEYGMWYFISGGCYFSATGEYDNEDDVTMVRLYNDPHFLEKDGSLYYVNDNGENAAGWQLVGGNSYYFRKNGKAVKNCNFKIGGILYKFNANGVCVGRYTGYIRNKDGSRVYYEDGVPDGSK